MDEDSNTYNMDSNGELRDYESFMENCLKYQRSVKIGLISGSNESGKIISYDNSTITLNGRGNTIRTIIMKHHIIKISMIEEKHSTNHNYKRTFEDNGKTIYDFSEYPI